MAQSKESCQTHASLGRNVESSRQMPNYIANQALAGLMDPIDPASETEVFLNECNDRGNVPFCAFAARIAYNGRRIASKANSAMF